MIGKAKLLAIIPARGGSKRIYRKNILELGGKPLIAWTIEAALQSNYIDRVIVSTDDDYISTISLEYGADIPFIRPADLSADTASSIDVVTHTIRFFENKNELYEYVVLLQPTSPLRTSLHIDSAIDHMKRKKGDAVISVCEENHSPLWCNTLPEDTNMSRFLNNEIRNKRSQDLPAYYRLNGAIYICNSSRILRENTFFLKNNLYAYLMDRISSVDVDSDLDFAFTSFLLGHKICQDQNAKSF